MEELGKPTFCEHAFNSFRVVSSVHMHRLQWAHFYSLSLTRHRLYRSIHFYSGSLHKPPCLRHIMTGIKFCSAQVCLGYRRWPNTYLLTPWSRVLLEKLTGFAANQEIHPHFMEPEISLPYSQAPATCPCPEPTPSSLHNPFPLPEDTS